MAVSDPTGTVASPLLVLERSSDPPADHRRLAEVVAEVGAELVVVGLPVSLTGELGPAARRALDEVEALSEVLKVPVKTYDERLTTVSAERTLRARGVKSRAGRRVVDKLAAAVMLQSWLDGQTQGEEP